MFGDLDAEQMAGMAEMMGNPDIMKENFKMKRFIEMLVDMYEDEHPLQEGEHAIGFTLDRVKGQDGLYVSTAAFDEKGNALRVIQQWPFEQVFEKISIDGLMKSMVLIASGGADSWTQAKDFLTGAAEPQEPEKPTEN